MIAKWLVAVAIMAVGAFDALGPAYGDGFLYSNGAYTTVQGTPTGINNSGQIIGFGIGNDASGYLYSDGVYTTIKVPGFGEFGNATPFAINNSGQIIGRYFTDSPIYSGFLYSNGVYTLLDYIPTAINDSGEIVGTTYNYEGYLYDNGVYTIIDVPGSSYTEVTGINNSGQIIGYDSEGAFIYDDGLFTMLPPSDNFQTPISIDNAGQILFTSGFLYSNGVYTELNPPGSVYYSANILSGSGEVIGDATMAIPPIDYYYGFLFSDGAYSTLVVPGSVSAYGTYLTGINDSGQIVGTFSTPEPSTWAMMLLGFMCLGYAGYRRGMRG